MPQEILLGSCPCENLEPGNTTLVPTFANLILRLKTAREAVAREQGAGVTVYLYVNDFRCHELESADWKPGSGWLPDTLLALHFGCKRGILMSVLLHGQNSCAIR